MASKATSRTRRDAVLPSCRVTARLAVLAAAAWLSACGAKFEPGQCIRARDGYVWYVADTRGGKYVLMGWQGASGAGWGNPVEFDFAHTEGESLDYAVVACPVYEGGR